MHRPIMLSFPLSYLFAMYFIIETIYQDKDFRDSEDNVLLVYIGDKIGAGDGD